jgi:hypothetical protein
MINAQAPHRASGYCCGILLSVRLHDETSSIRLYRFRYRIVHAGALGRLPCKSDNTEVTANKIRQ